MQVNNGYAPFAWPKKFPKNDQFPVFTVNDETELNAALAHQYPSGSPKPNFYGTHSGVFHCDEVMASIIFKYAGVFTVPGAVVRTRSDELLKKFKVVYDVGAIFDPKELRFDHHMKDFKETFDKDHDVKLSSCGLAYKYHGKDAIKNILAEWGITDSKQIDYTYMKLYDEFILAIDGGDNGISQYPSDIKPKYHINSHVQYRVSRLNPPWNSEGTQSPDPGFIAAMNVCEEEFLWQVYSQACIIYPAYDIVANAYKNREKFHPSGQLIYLGKGCPWKEHLNILEEENEDPNKKPILFVLAKDNNKDKPTFKTQGVPDKPGSFTCRLFLNEKWRGLRDTALEQASEIPGAIFVHASGFVGFANSLAGVIKMSEATMANAIATQPAIPNVKPLPTTSAPTCANPNPQPPYKCY
eukprot:TRINITY_DN3991_c2_g1_i1.p4 TRINITY_DN3991_c2_g1~~TRINITY_DN3991_c2_g1_i1.p4  ORF type:complete len:411 (-),score=40.35 TRINITY_DN3991_c2_g1_i1:1640-2872(-)